MTTQPLAKRAAHVVVPLAIGMAIYLFWRSREIHVFPRLAALGLDAPISAIRAFVAPSRAYVPKFVLFNLPDALWSYALGAWLAGAWRSGAAKASWLTGGAAVVIAAEGLQGVGVVPGTFDPIDLVASITGYALALVLASPRTSLRLTTDQQIGA